MWIHTPYNADFWCSPPVLPGASTVTLILFPIFFVDFLLLINEYLTGKNYYKAIQRAFH